MKMDLTHWTNVAWYSGGKDSTAMLLIAIKEKWKIDHVVFFDNGILNDEAYKAMKKIAPMLEPLCDGITILKPDKSFEYMLKEKPVKKAQGETVKGYGWPERGLGWCCRWEQTIIRKWERTIRPVLELQAVVIDDSSQPKKSETCHWRKIHYPLVQRNLSSEDSIKICRFYGFDFGGYYDRGNRHLSCWPCPYNHIAELEYMFQCQPEKWSRLKELDENVSNKYRKNMSVLEWEQRIQKKIDGDEDNPIHQYKIEFVKAKS